MLLYGCTTKTLTKCTEKKLGWNNTRILHTISNKSWKQHFIKTTFIRPLTSCLIKHARHCWRRKNIIIWDVLKYLKVIWVRGAGLNMSLNKFSLDTVHFRCLCGGKFSTEVKIVYFYRQINQKYKVFNLLWFPFSFVHFMNFIVRNLFYGPKLILRGKKKMKLYLTLVYNTGPQGKKSYTLCPIRHFNFFF